MILEAGCGTAQLVLALNVNGNDCLSLDFAVQTQKHAQHAAEPLPLISGDLTAIDISMKFSIRSFRLVLWSTVSQALNLC